MNRLILVAMVVCIGVFTHFDATLLQTLVWTGTFLATMSLTTRIIALMYPGDPKPVPEGEIEDAVLVFTFFEALSLHSGYVLAWGATLLASFLVL